jgi:subtilase family serine protease
VGAVPAGQSTTRYFLVATNASGKIDLKGKPVVPAIDPGNTFTGQDTIQVRPETVVGTYVLKACADSGKVVAEKNENNNCLTSTGTITVTPRPDLVTTYVVLKDPAPITVALGGTESLEFTVTNQGPGPAAASLMRFFLVDPNSPLTKDLKGHPSVPALAASKAATVKGNVTVFLDTTPGTYNVRGCADYNKQVTETDENSNCVMAVGTVTVQ